MGEARDGQSATDIADEVIDCFGELHPAVALTWNEWNDLKEMIVREFMAHCGHYEGGAAALINDPLYLAHRRTAPSSSPTSSAKPEA